MTKDIESPNGGLGNVQVILESCEFRHKQDLFSGVSGSPTKPVRAHIGVELIGSEDGKGAAVRLRVICDDAEAPYFYSVAYLVFYQLKSIPKGEEERLAITGATMAMPFVRELVANLSSRGRFGPTWVSPFNFAAMSSELKAGVAKKPEKKRRARKG